MKGCQVFWVSAAKSWQTTRKEVLTAVGLKCLHSPVVLLSSQPRKTFGQLFCGSLDNYGILCVGLYRVMDEQGHNPEHKRGVW